VNIEQTALRCYLQFYFGVKVNIIQNKSVILGL